MQGDEHEAEGLESSSDPSMEQPAGEPDATASQADPADVLDAADAAAVADSDPGDPGDPGDIPDPYAYDGGDAAPGGTPVFAALPALSSRLDGVQASVTALSTRVDALLGATTSYRSLIVDRISEYGEAVARQGRAQAAALEEYRHATDRVIAEMRRTVSESEEVIHRLAGRVDELVADVGNLGDLSRSAIVEGRDFAASVDKVTRSVRDGLDGFTTRVLERLDQVRSGLETELASVRTDAGRLRQSVADAAAAWNAERAEASVESLRDDLAGLRSVVLEWPELGEMRDDVRALADRALDAGASNTGDPIVIEELTELRGEIRTIAEDIRALEAVAGSTGSGGDADADAIAASVGAVVRDVLQAELDSLRSEDRPTVAGAAPLVEELVAVREEVAALRRRIAVRSKGETVTLDEAQLAEIVDAVASRLSDSFEIVEDTPPPARARSSRAKRA